MLKIRHKFASVSKLSVIRHLSSQSTQPATKETSEYDDHRLREFERISNIQQKVKTKKPQKPPFVKNLFLGIFDTDLLTYPELTNEQLNNLNSKIKQAEMIVQQNEVKECDRISKDFLKRLATGRLLGLQGSQLMGGRELSVTEMCRFTEVISDINLKNSVINNEYLGVQTLVKCGSDNLKRKYLQKIIDGDSLSAFCTVEPLPSKIDVFGVTALRSADGKTWLLNGQKKLVINGSDADFYVVVATTNYIIRDEIREQKFTAFLVERDFGGITSSRQSSVDGVFQLSDVVFENTPIPSENIIGIEEEGENVLSTVYPEYRLSTGPICSVILKNLINKATEHYINASKAPNFLYETDAIRIKMGEFLSSLYAIDSMVYLTAGLVDNYENQDTELESTIVKVFASEQAFMATSSCLDLIGPETSVDKHWCNQLHKEALCQVTLNDNNDNLKILIALFGLRYAGQKINTLVKELRNPLFNATAALKRMWTHRRHADDNPKLDLFLYHHLHPSCVQAAQRLEYCVLRLQYATEIFFTRYGAEVINKHSELRLLGECVIDIYAMAACLGRASRSYCIGLQHSDHEMTLAAAFTVNATKRVKSKLLTIIDGPFVTTDENFRFVSERLFNCKNYYPVHPLTRNF
ncbi:hypothetical protein Zmor_000924 [Zophobas morio]|uniref:Acyl-CoA dehydrogenase family member 9, mitochondrial n=1 Tax=Zophobas morio TaxID=2755281 RepID=A0AA38IY36_9CUCU|nr:hypothetical protein Zmor_000924 [Zophobas morio]